MDALPDFSKFTEDDWRKLHERDVRRIHKEVGDMADAYRNMWTDHRTMLAQHDRLIAENRELRERLDLLTTLVLDHFDKGA